MGGGLLIVKEDREKGRWYIVRRRCKWQLRMRGNCHFLVIFVFDTYLINPPFLGLLVVFYVVLDGFRTWFVASWVITPGRETPIVEDLAMIPKSSNFPWPYIYSLSRSVKLGNSKWFLVVQLIVSTSQSQKKAVPLLPFILLPLISHGTVRYVVSHLSKVNST